MSEATSGIQTSTDPDFAALIRATERASCLAAKAGVGPDFDLGRCDDLLGLMRVEGARAGGPAFRQYLHREQFGVDFRLEGAGRADSAGCAVVGFHSFIRAIGHVPDIGLGHCCITPKRCESFAPDRKRFFARSLANRSLQ